MIHDSKRTIDVSHDESTRAPDPRAFVLGGGHLGRGLAERLAKEHDGIAFVDDHREALAAVENARAYRADITDASSLDDRVPGLAGADFAAVMSHQDTTGFLVARVLVTVFGVEDVVAAVSDPRKHEPIAESGVETVCVSSAITDLVRDLSPGML